MTSKEALTPKETLTPKEALEAIRKELQDRLEFPINLTLEYRLVKQSLNELEVLKKRNEPKKVVFNVKDTIYVGCADCPTCGATIDRDDESGLINFCQYCGQALDWSEVK